MKHKLLNKLLFLTLLTWGGVVINPAWADTYERLTSIANIDESAEYVLGIDGTGFHYTGTSSWGKTALPSSQSPIIYTLTKAQDGSSFTAKATISGTLYYLQVHNTTNTFSMSTSAGTNTDLIIGTTLNNAGDGEEYAIANKTTPIRHLRRNGTSGLRSYASTTGALAFFYKVVSTYAITATSNNDSYGTVSVTGTTIRATPNDGYRVVAGDGGYTVTSGTATVTNNGDNTFSVTPSTDCTIQINFEALPTYTVTFSDGGSVTQASYGASVTLPSRGAISSYTFAGWSEDNVASETTTAPTIIPAGNYTPTENITLYPVYSKTEGGGGSINETASVNIASYATAHSWVSGTQYTSIIADENITITGADNGNNSKFYNSSSPHDWRFYATNDGYFTVSTSSGELTSVTITYTGNTLTYGGNNVTSGSAVSVSGASATFNVSGSSNNSKVSAISVDYTISGGGTTYYWSAPVVVPVSSVSVDATASVNVGETTTLVATISPDNATNKNVTWTSSDETVATVDENGVVTGVAAGEATITVTSVADGTKTANCTVTVTTVAVTGVTVAPTSATVKIGKTVTLTPTISPVNATNKNVTWESNNTSIATVDGGVVTGVAAGEATITVKSAADPTKSASCTITVITAGDGSKAKPYDVEEALEIISGYSSGSGSAENVYTKGIVSSVGSMYSGTMLTYFISIDGTSENTIQVFRGKNLGNTNFAATSDISVNDEVIVYGQLYKYNSTPEINTGNYIYSRNGVKIPEITFGAASYEVVYNGSLTITATADCSGTITYSSSDNTVAEINATTGVVTPHKAGEVTITANVAASVDNIAGSKDVTLTVTDGRTPAGIAFANASVTKTWGEAFTGQELTNPNSIDVTYESSEPTVATVNASGVVTVVKAGETTITASFAGDEDYMSAEVSYTLTVNKAAAGLSFTVTEYDFDLNDESFTGVAVNNPNSLTVTYESSDEDIALVDENDGTLALDASAEGTVTITASFAGNDNYNAGNASYTITITDPDRKGTKKNPYTVAEVNSGSYSGYNYVKGYIVGYFVGKDSNASSSGNSNIALSDSPSEISGANTIAVQLPSGDIRDAWNINDNNVIGYEVIVYGNITSYFAGKTGVKNTSEISAVSVPAKFNASGYATFASTYPLDFTDDSEFSAWQITATNSGTGVLTFSQITEIVAAGTGVLLKGSASETVSIPVAASGSDISGTNKLVGITTATDVTAGQYYGLKGSSFVPVNAGTVPAGKALLPVSGGGVKAFTFIFEDDADGISEIENGKLKVEEEEAIYNLAGQRISRMQKGINIVNGKKVLY